MLDLDEDDARGTVEAIEAAGGRALAVGRRRRRRRAVPAAVDRIAAELGPPVVLVNNAGVTRDNLLFKMSDADWDIVMHVHLRGSFLMTRAVQKHMTEAKWGRIVNLSSTSALGNRGQANYATAKAGLQGFTKTLAIELGKFGVTANAIAPGFIVTDMTQGDRGADRPGVGAVRRGARRGDPGRAAPASPRTSRTPCRSWSARARASSPVRSSTSPAAPKTSMEPTDPTHLSSPGRPLKGRGRLLRTTGRGRGSAPGPGRRAPNAANPTATAVSSHGPAATPAIAVMAPSRPVALETSADDAACHSRTPTSPNAIPFAT